MASNFPPAEQPWPEKWPNNLPCVFSRDQAVGNAEFLLQSFRWLPKAIQLKREHPLVSAWRIGTPDHFIMLNTLAEDMRALQGRPGLLRLLNDMARPKEFGPANHTLHIAALFERGGNAVTEFLDAKNDRIPDFVTHISGVETAIEAKMLTTSQSAKRFSGSGYLILERLKAEVLVPANATGRFFFICKDAEKVPSFDIVSEGLRQVLTVFDGEHAAHARSELINIHVEPAGPNPVFDEIRELQWVCRRSDEEDVRIERILRSANRQIKAKTNGHSAGIACVSIDEHQDPIAVRQLVEGKFVDGQYTSTSGMLLHRAARYEGIGPRGPVDLLSIIGNPSAAAPIGEVQLRSFGVTANLDENLPPPDTLSCYCFALIEGRVHTVGPGGLYINPVVRLPISMFE